jgi:hypothetical protein
MSMRLITTAGITAMLIFSVFAAELAGTWKGSMETQMGNTPVTITLQPGSSVTGKVQVGEYNAAIEKGKLEGDKITFEITIGPGTVKYDGILAGDELKFNVIGTQGDKYSLICKRQK